MTGTRKSTRPEKKARFSHALNGYYGRHGPRPTPTGFLLKIFIRAATGDTVHYRVLVIQACEVYLSPTCHTIFEQNDICVA